MSKNRSACREPTTLTVGPGVKKYPLGGAPTDSEIAGPHEFCSLSSVAPTHRFARINSPIIQGGAVPAGLVIIATIIAYLPSLGGKFIWNDSDYVTEPALRSVHGLIRIWTEPGATQQYYPLLHSAFWLQHRLFGDDPLGYHIVNVLLHAGSAVLFALVLRHLLNLGASGPAPFTSKINPAAVSQDERDHARPYAGAEWLAALLFALHPVHVESVAWITEQKNTLSLLLYLGAGLAYLRFDESRRPNTYVLALGLFVLSLWAKTVTASLPAALLVVFWWKRGQLNWRRDIQPLVPWFILAAAAGLFSSWVEKKYVGAQGWEFDLPLIERALVAGRAIWFYAAQLIWPFNLNFVYERWTIDATVWWQWLFPLGVIIVGVGFWLLRTRSRAPLAGFLFFIGSLFPVLGFVNLYGARYSWVWDHWQYLPDLGPIALLAVGLTILWQRMAPTRRWVRPVSVGVITIFLGALTWSHCGMFADDKTLFLTTIERNPRCWMAHTNWGAILAETPGKLPEAIAEYQKALRIQPDNAEAHNNLGLAWSQMPGRLPDAIAEFQTALRLQPDNPKVHNNLGDALMRTPGQMANALSHIEEALRLDPKYAAAHNNLGLACSQLPGRLSDAIAHYQTAARLQPHNPKIHANLGLALARQPGRLPEAISSYQESLRLQPDNAIMHNALGVALAMTPGKLPEGIGHFEESIRLQPDLAEAHYSLGLAWAMMPDRLPDAIAQFRETVRLQPTFAKAWHDLGVCLYQTGDLRAAVAAFREELRLSPNPSAQETLDQLIKQAEGR